VIDFHCHLDLYGDPIKVADESQQRNVGVLSVTNTPSAWAGTSRLAVSRPVIRTALGLHPQLAHERKHELRLFEKYLPQTRFVGEVGLDGSPEFRATWEDQVDVFSTVLDLCCSTGDKILSIHSRKSATTVIDMLGARSEVGRPILHWFSGTKTELRCAVSIGCWFSVGPAMTRTAKGIALIAEMPRSRVLLESDGPFTRIDKDPIYPWNVSIAARSLARLWETDAHGVDEILSENNAALIS
jgi:TatD DNase family protein